VLDPFVFTEILPINSIVNPNTPSEDYLDLYNPFSFFDFLKYINTDLSPLEVNNLYVEYIKLWGETKNNTKTQINQTIQERYVELIKEITIKYSTLEEKRFISNIDYSDETELDIVLPFYSRKIVEICNFYADKREKLKFKLEKNKKKGTPSSVESSIFETITDVVFSDVLETSNYQKLVDEQTLLKDLNIEIEELYDIYTNYLDIDPSYDYTEYDVKSDFRKQFFSSNVNDIDANIFINIDEAIKNELFGKVYVFLNEFKKNFSINYDINKIELNCKPDDRLFNIVNENKPKATRLVQLRYDLIKKYIGTDFYYIATGSTITDVTSSILFKADNPSGNLLNRHFPTTASIEEESDLQSCRRIGLFFTPEKNSILYYSVPEKKYKIDESKLEANKLYIFPDPNLYGNTIGLSRKFNYEYPLIHIADYTKSVKNYSLGYTEGDINSNPYAQDFYAYFSRNQLKDSFYFGKDGLTNNFSNLYDKGIVTKWAADIYGNQFSLFKPKSKQNLVNNTTVIEISSVIHETYCGGPIRYSDNTPLPEIVLAGDPEWVKPDLWSSDYYYNNLVEGSVGSTTNEIMERGMDSSAIGFTPEFDNEYILSSIKYKEFDGGLISEEDEFIDHNFEDNTRFIVNQTIDNNETILYDSVQDDNLNSYEIRNSYGSIYVKDIITGYVSELSSKLKYVFSNKYENIKEELYNNILDFNIYNDFLWIRTKNHIIFEKLSYQDGSYIDIGNGKNYIKYKEDDNFLINASNPFIFEDRDYALIVLLSGYNTESYNYSVIPTIYKINYNTCSVSLVYPINLTQSIIDTFKNNSAINPTKLRKINKPTLLYNKRNNKYAIICTLEDQNEFPYFYKVLFDYDGINMINIECKLYNVPQEIEINTVNLFDNNILSNLNISDITNNSNVTIDQNEGTLNFG